MSMDDVINRDYVVTTADDPLAFTLDGVNFLKSVESTETNNGLAVNATLNAGYKTDSWSVKLVGDIIFNDSAWFNNLAQSPKFFAQRILNSDYDGETVKHSVRSPLYSTFDALYNFAPKFSPAPITMRTDDNGFKQQPSSYNIAPYNKNSWTGNVYSKAQIALLNAMADPNIQMVLPNGMASANREGGRANLIGNVGEWFEAQALFGIYTQVAPLYGFTDISYTEYGAGLKADIFKVLGFSKPLEISGSYKHSERTMEFDPTLPFMGTPVDGKAEFKTDFINAGLYVQYLPRLGVTAGFQMINMEMNDLQQKQSVAEYAGIAATVPMVKGKQMQWMVGLDYTLDKSAWLSLNLGMVTVENTYNTDPALYAADGAVNLPAHAEDVKVGGVWPTEFTNKFTQLIVEASINVEF
jgi:hypothetical protein